jgi:hypothetical protein
LERKDMDDDLFGDGDINGFVDSIIGNDLEDLDWSTAIGPGSTSPIPRDYPSPTRIPTAASLPDIIPESRPKPPRKLTGYGNAGKPRPRNRLDGGSATGRVGEIAGTNTPGERGNLELRNTIQQHPANPGPERGRGTLQSISGGGINQPTPDGGRVEGVRTRVKTDSFESVNFTCYIKDVKFNVGGEAVAQLVIPYEDRESAKALVDTRGLTILVSARRYDYES